MQKVDIVAISSKLKTKHIIARFLALDMSTDVANTVVWRISAKFEATEVSASMNTMDGIITDNIFQEVEKTWPVQPKVESSMLPH